VIALILSIACTGDQTDSSAPEDDTGSPCVDVPEVTYDNWGRGFMTTHCQGCHASTALDRYGAPEEVTFDSEAQVLDQLERIQIRTLEDEDMPPAGGIPPDDLTLLSWWLDCGV
jgi:uncharacterized membrane protein